MYAVTVQCELLCSVHSHSSSSFVKKAKSLVIMSTTRIRFPVGSNLRLQKLIFIISKRSCKHVVPAIKSDSVKPLPFAVDCVASGSFKDRKSFSVSLPRSFLLLLPSLPTFPWVCGGSSLRLSLHTSRSSNTSI